MLHLPQIFLETDARIVEIFHVGDKMLYHLDHHHALLQGHCFVSAARIHELRPGRIVVPGACAETQDNRNRQDCAKRSIG
ncbi:MAG: hypothetical protein OXJ56_05750 [Rhodospirillaceae bacterium]|nr:hypothetical protein [Rhodospirillaceae bacterium]